MEVVTLSDEELLQEIKATNNFTGEYHDKALKNHIQEVKFFLVDAGISKETVNSNKALGVINRGVMDLWNYGANDGDLSGYFCKRVTQLKLNECGGSE